MTQKSKGEKLIRFDRADDPEPIMTERTCAEHPPAVVTWDYTERGDCPACTQIKENTIGEAEYEDEIKCLNKDIDEANEKVKASEARIDQLETSIDAKANHISLLKHVVKELKKEK